MTPMMAHYLEKKRENPDCILLYRLGDFYECFFDDAELVAKELEIALTGRDCGEENKAPMCGVPYHALDTYLAKLVGKGYKVAICEQLTAPEKGKIVERDVIRIVTPGTVVETEMLDAKRNNFLASVYVKRGKCSISYLDISTGEFYSTLLSGDNLLSQINDELLRICPTEIISNSLARDFAGKLGSVAIGQLPKFNTFYEWAYTYKSAVETIKKQYGIANLQGFDIADKEECICSCGALLEYCNQTQKRQLSHLKAIQFIRNDLYMHLDSNARKNLELTASMKDGRKQGSLINVLDHTKTPMGARYFKSAIEQPYQNESIINERLDAVEEIVKDVVAKNAFLSTLDEIGDIERICSKVVYGSVTPKDCLTLKRSLACLPKIKLLLSKFKTKKLVKINNSIVDFSSLVDLLDKSIKEDAGVLTRDGDFIKSGFNEKLDEYRNAKTEGAKWLANLEMVESEQTGIKNLKIKYNRVFGYMIEVSKSNLDKVPNRYIRKQTIANNERFVTEELKEIENKILNSEENALKLETEIYEYIKSVLCQNLKLLLEASEFIAELDFLISLADVAIKNNYCKPIVSNNLTELKIVDGRHPVVESLLSGGQFIPNDILLNDSTDRIMILTGPNMAGKSTYMRQVAIIVLMAHIGSFVPCKYASMPTFDRIFTRVGASDDLAFGQSTFMVEMSEVATILNNATDR
ncbi:MAG: DNA mismatch repair protein MutS, partial [Christensenellales bacterium]